MSSQNIWLILRRTHKPCRCRNTALGPEACCEAVLRGKVRQHLHEAQSGTKTALSRSPFLSSVQSLYRFLSLSIPLSRSSFLCLSLSFSRSLPLSPFVSLSVSLSLFLSVPLCVSLSVSSQSFSLSPFLLVSLSVLLLPVGI